MANKWRGIQCGKNSDNKVTQSEHHSTFRLTTVSFMWVTCPARFSRRRQRGTTVRLGSCWQTILGPSAISSCFLSTKALAASGLYLFIPLFKRLTWKTELFMCVHYKLGLQQEPLGRLPQRIKALGHIWCRTRVVSNAGISWFPPWVH